LKTTLGASSLLALDGAMPAFLARTARAAGGGRAERGTVLVVIQLSGGNDGLNTVVPFEDDAYQRSRPTLRLSGEQVLKLGAGVGLHPAMPAFQRLFDEGRLSIIQGVGYPESSRDHSEAMQNWHTARPEANLEQTGWLGRALDRTWARGETDLPGVFIGSIAAPFSLRTEQAVVPAIQSLEAWLPAKDPAVAWPRVPPDVPAGGGRGSGAGPFAAPVGLPLASNTLADFLGRTAAQAAACEARLETARQAATSGMGGYSAFGLARSLQLIAALMRAELGIRVYSVELGGGGIGGFDTHAGQAANHGALLRELAESVSAFVADLRRDKLLDSMLLMTFSEFGRTLAENGRRGTDHGAAAPVFAAGGRVQGGLLGSWPSLTDLEGGAPKFHTDFRRVYATVLERWLGFDSREVLGGSYAPLEGLIA
jgi:uncharacterized protein (DUF1501 family)